MKKTRNVFGIIFLVTGIAIFYGLAATSISAELDDVLHGPPLTAPVREHMPSGLNKALDAVLPKKVENLPYIAKLNPAHESTNDNPFQQFNVVEWMGIAFVIAALADVGTAYLTRTKVQVEE